jgi:hypothetical protein
MRSNSGAFIAALDSSRSRRAWSSVVGAVIGRAERWCAVHLISRPPSALHGDFDLEPLGGLHDWRGPERH